MFLFMFITFYLIRRYSKVIIDDMLIFCVDCVCVCVAFDISIWIIQRHCLFVQSHIYTLFFYTIFFSFSFNRFSAFRCNTGGYDQWLTIYLITMEWHKNTYATLLINLQTRVAWGHHTTEREKLRTCFLKHIFFHFSCDDHFS